MLTVVFGNLYYKCQVLSHSLFPLPFASLYAFSNVNDWFPAMILRSIAMNKEIKSQSTSRMWLGFESGIISLWNHCFALCFFFQSMKCMCAVVVYVYVCVSILGRAIQHKFSSIIIMHNVIQTLACQPKSYELFMLGRTYKRPMKITRLLAYPMWLLFTARQQ